MSRRVTAALALALLLVSASVAAEPAPPSEPTYVQTEEPRLLCVPATPIEKCRDLPPGRFLDELTFSALDAELKRLQDAETRLAAENKAMRESVQGWQPGWRTLVVTLVVGAVGGFYIHTRF